MDNKSAGDEDPAQWLEDSSDPAVREWVKTRVCATVSRFASGEAFSGLQARLREVLDSDGRLLQVLRTGDYYYNFRRGTEHPRGIWRRVAWQMFAGHRSAWETVLDLDALAVREQENWVWKAPVFPPMCPDRCLLALSRGGADAAVLREFDLSTLDFVPGGFVVPEAKTHAVWAGAGSLYVATDQGEGTLTASGYPRRLCLWSRGSRLAEAVPLLEGERTDLWVRAYVLVTQAHRYDVLVRQMDFYRCEYHLYRQGALDHIPVPEDADIDFVGGQMLIRLRSDYLAEDGKHYRTGSLLAVEFPAFMDGCRNFALLFEPERAASIQEMRITGAYVVLDILDCVRARVQEWTVREGRWTCRDIPVARCGSVSIQAESRWGESGCYFMQESDFLTPDTLFRIEAGHDGRTLVSRAEPMFESAGLQVEQYFAVSRDGTRIPYFCATREGMPGQEVAPVLLYAYGGFSVSLTPYYSALLGRGWLERGGTYVMANIRGGGEFGPQWHQSARRENRPRAFEDFIAVAEDLVARGITVPARLGIMGGSNGGLLMGAMYTQRPDLFGAVVCRVPLLDMRRYHLLLAGHSWMAEYGNPDVEEDWTFLKAYSPYHNVDAQKHYPPLLLTTSTRDDRVHPGHARKMKARLEACDVADVWYYENPEGGHAGAADNAQTAFNNALIYTFLWEMLAAGESGSIGPSAC